MWNGCRTRDGRQDLGRGGRRFWGWLARPSGVAVLVLAFVLSAFACGPWFPVDLLSREDKPFFAVPTARFDLELDRMRLRPTRHPAVPTFDFQEGVLPLELADLDAALKARRVSDDQARDIRERYSAIRQELDRHVRKLREWNGDRRQRELYPMLDAPPLPPAPVTPGLSLPPDLPVEFLDYLEGAIAWHNPADEAKTAAREAWERLLKRPARERRWKSTWATFMLGRYWETREPSRAVACFRQVRFLASRGFPDSIGLGAASLGLEARVRLREKNYPAAMELYLEQLAAGDRSAVNSLRFTANAVFDDPAADLPELARNPVTQRLLTSYLISLDDSQGFSSSPVPEDMPAPHWLAALESANVTDVESAERLALLAYKANNMDLARRWIKRTKRSPFGDWLQAKLLLYEGKLDAATRLLAEVTRAMPLAPPDRTNAAVPWYEGVLSIDSLDACSPSQAAHGELAILQLARRDYLQALDCFLRAGFWSDAAYVAERVLTLPELRAFVDQSWPSASPEETEAEQLAFGDASHSPVVVRKQIRYLLARRLARAGDYDSARQYYPPEWVAQFDALTEALGQGESEALAPEARAEAWLAAAYITRTNGLELLGTEVSPDGRIYDGDFVHILPVPRGLEARFNISSSDELRRAEEHVPSPDVRWHYRYLAAALCWDAAALLPDNDDQTAFMLWQGGWWIRNLDPLTADAFYKSLVLRNPGTELGAEADRRRWFPTLDENRRIIPRKPPEPPAESSSESLNEPPGAEPDAHGPAPAVGRFRKAVDGAVYYVVHAGDNLPRIAVMAGEAGFPVSVRDLLEANPDLKSHRLMVGQLLFIPYLVPEPGR